MIKLTWSKYSGIGGGGFMLLRTSDGEFENIDFREKAPAAAFEDMYNKNIVRGSSRLPTKTY
jgi:gamma-glutamyltranspeptidase